MAVYEKNGYLKYKDESGNIHILQPETVPENVNGLNSKLIEAKTVSLPVDATSTNGVAYVATVQGVTSLTTGLSFIIVPKRVSASVTPTLNVNNLGAKTLRLRSTGYSATTVAPSATSWLSVNKPVRVTYDGTWWVADVVADPGSDFDYGTEDIGEGADLETGKLYFVYE